MSRPRLLDLFCGAGGAGAGYAAAGFDVVGVDLNPQPRYPFAFVQADALAFLEAGGAAGFDAIHASPPCQAYCGLTKLRGDPSSHPDLVGPTRAALVAAGPPWVIENVVGAPLVAPMMLCGSMFGLSADVRGERRPLRRHRLFESPVFLWPPGPCAHVGRAIGVYGSGGGSSRRDGLWQGRTADRRLAMGIDWMTTDELSQTIPPAYTEHIGRQLLAAVESAA